MESSCLPWVINANQCSMSPLKPRPLPLPSHTVGKGWLSLFFLPLQTQKSEFEIHFLGKTPFGEIKTDLNCPAESSAINMGDFIFLLMDRQETAMPMSCPGQPALSHPLGSQTAAAAAWQSRWDTWKPGTYVTNVSCRAPPITLHLSHSTINAEYTVVTSQMERTTWGRPHQKAMSPGQLRRTTWAGHYVGKSRFLEV